MLEKLKEEVCKANLELVDAGLVVLTWGNISGIDRDKAILAIKPSGVDYKELTSDKIVLVDLDGKVVEGELNPSSDTPTHLELYKKFEGVGGIAHTHSPKATSFAQSCRPVPCFGTTHADHYYGDVPVTRVLTADEVKSDYEKNTGLVILERFKGLDPLEFPSVLVAKHGPFCWGKNAKESLKNSIALEVICQMAIDTLALNPNSLAIENYILEKHFCRKHGKNAYYGQGNS